PRLEAPEADGVGVLARRDAGDAFEDALEVGGAEADGVAQVGERDGLVGGGFEDVARAADAGEVGRVGHLVHLRPEGSRRGGAGGYALLAPPRNHGSWRQPRRAAATPLLEPPRPGFHKCGRLTWTSVYA